MRSSFLVLLALCVGQAHGQTSDLFDVTLISNYESAVRTLELYGGLSGSPASIAALRGSQIALSTTALLVQRRLDTPALENALEAVKFN